MKTVLAIAALLVLAGCGDSADPSAAGDQTAQAVDTQPETDSEAVTNAPPTLPQVCLDDSPVEPQQIGTVNTIVVPENAEYFDGDVAAEPGTACPGDLVSFAVSITNTSDAPQAFSAHRGLLFISGGLPKWSLALLDDLTVTVQPGQQLIQTVTGTIPPVAPGTYRVSPEGSGLFGEITILDPTADD